VSCIVICTGHIFTLHILLRILPFNKTVTIVDSVICCYLSRQYLYLAYLTKKQNVVDFKTTKTDHIVICFYLYLSCNLISNYSSQYAFVQCHFFIISLYSHQLDYCNCCHFLYRMMIWMMLMVVQLMVCWQVNIRTYTAAFRQRCLEMWMHMLETIW
jgi:hypothetical protein